MASSLLLEYIQINQNTKMNFLNCISYFSFTDCMELDEATIKSLDILYNFSTKSHTIGTLF